MNKLLIGLAVLAASVPLCVAQATDARAGAMAFMQNGIGARALGMGNAFVAAADDAHALFWNPAGMTRMDGYSNHLALTGALMGVDRAHNFMAYSHRFDGKGALGLGMAHYGVDGIELYNEQGDSLGTAQDREFAALLGLARDADYKFRYGATFKGYWQQLAGERALGYGLDLGFNLMPYKGSYLLLAGVLQNAVSSLHWPSGRSEDADTLLKLAVSDRFFVWRLLLEADLDIPVGYDGDLRTHFGMEYWPHRLFALRGGLMDADPTAGLTLKRGYLEIDYGLAFDRAGLGNQHQASVTIKF